MVRLHMARALRRCQPKNFQRACEQFGPVPAPQESLSSVTHVTIASGPQIEGSEGFSVIAFALSVVILALFSLRVVDGGVWLNIPGARHAGVPIE